MSRAKPISPAAWHPLDAFTGGTGMSRAVEALCGGAHTVEAQAAIKAATEARHAEAQAAIKKATEAHLAAEHMDTVDAGVRNVVASLLDQGVPNIEAELGQIGAVLIETARAALRLRGRPENEIDYLIGARLSDEAVLAALDQLQRGH